MSDHDLDLLVMVLFAVCSIGLAAPSQAANAVTNGDFEAGWTLDGDGDSVPDGWTKHTGATTSDPPSICTVSRRTFMNDPG